MATPKIGTEVLFYSTDKQKDGRFAGPYYGQYTGELNGQSAYVIFPPGEMARYPVAPIAASETERERPFAVVLESETVQIKRALETTRQELERMTVQMEKTLKQAQKEEKK